MKYYCSKCGAELMRGGRFCPSCGAQIIGVAKAGEDLSSMKTEDKEAVVFKKEEPVPDTKHRYEYVPGEDDDYDGGGRRGAGLLTILLGVLVAASAIFFIMVFFKSKSFFGGNSGGGQVLTAHQEETQEETTQEEPAEALQPEEQENAGQEAVQEPTEEEYEEPVSEETPEEEEIEEPEEEPEEEEEEEEPQEPYDGSLGNSDYVLKESNSRYYSRGELERLDDRSVLLAINEIYARHGRKFVMAEYRDYFESKSWYHGTVEPSDFDAMGSSVFNEYENANRLLLIEIAQDRGLR